MKKLLLWGLVFFLVVAFVRAEGLSYPNKIELGSTEENFRNEGKSYELKLENKDNKSYTIELVTTFIKEEYKSKYNVTFSHTKISVEANSTANVTIKYFVPKNEDAGTIELGNLNLRFEGKDHNIPLYLNTKSMLQISKVEVKINNKEKKLEAGETTKRAKPDDDVVFDIEIKNLFPKDIEISDIGIELLIEEIDEGDDLEESAEEFDLKADKKESKKIEFKVPFEVDEGEYDGLIKVTGSDDNGADHSAKMEFYFKVDKDKHEARITKLELRPEKIACGEKSLLTVEITNYGSEDEDNAVLSIVNNDLGIAFNKLDIKLSSDYDDEDVSYQQILEILGNKSGKFPIDVYAYPTKQMNLKEGEKKWVSLEVGECKAVEEIKEEKKEVITGEAVKEKIEVNKTTEGEELAEEEFEEFVEEEKTSKEDLLLMGLFGVVVVFLIIIIILVIKLTSKKEEE